MNKKVTRRDFLRLFAAANAALMIHLLKPSLGTAEASLKTEQETFQPEAAVDALTVDPVSVHYKPGIIYVKA